VDLGEAAERNIIVAEQTDSNTVSVAEHAVMQILALVRNYIPAYNDVVDGGWSIGEIAARSHDLEHKTVGIYGAGRIGHSFRCGSSPSTRRRSITSAPASTRPRRTLSVSGTRGSRRCSTAKRTSRR
jgi:hypothetical protein